MTDPLAGPPDWIPLFLPHQRFGEAAHQFLGQPAGEAPISVRWFRRPDGTFAGKAWFDRRAEGPPGHAHGGSMAAVLDEAMGACAWAADHAVLAGEITIRFRTALPLEQTCDVHAQVERVDGKRVATSARLIGPDGTVHATGKGVFVILGAERFAAMGVAIAGS